MKREQPPSDSESNRSTPIKSRAPPDSPIYTNPTQKVSYHQQLKAKLLQLRFYYKSSFEEESLEEPVSPETHNQDRNTSKQSGMFITSKIKQFNYGGPIIREQFHIDGPCSVLHFSKYRLILDGRFERVFQVGDNIGVYLPQIMTSRSTEMQPEEQTIVISRFGGGPPDSPTIDVNLMLRPFIILEPKILIDVTLISSFIQCKRKIVLEHYIESSKITNDKMLLGTACHWYLESLVKKQIIPNQCPQQNIKTVYKQFLHNMHLLDFNEQKFQEEGQVRIQNLNKFYQKYLKPLSNNSHWKLLPKVLSQTPNSQLSLIITDIMGSQILIKSQSYGIKGKIDLLLRGKLIQRQPSATPTDVHIAFELKTGEKPSFSDFRQVDLYCLLLRQKYPHQPACGLLYYSKAGKFIVRREDYSEVFPAVMIIRNLIVGNKLQLQKNKDCIELPEFTSNFSNCKRSNSDGDITYCELAWECGMFSQMQGNQIQGSQIYGRSNKNLIDFKYEIPQIIEKVNIQQNNYFKKWMRFSHLEQSESGTVHNPTQIWFQISETEIQKINPISNDNIRLTLTQTHQQYDQLQKAEKLFEESEEIRLIIKTIDLTENAKVMSIELKGKKVVLFLQFKNKTIQFNQRRLNILIQRGHGPRVEIEKFENKAYRKMRSTVAKFIKSEDRTLKSIVIGGQKYEPSQQTNEVENQVFEQDLDGLNIDQQEAMRMALKMDKFMLIQGMPGTGKTKLIVRMVESFYNRNMRVLVSTFVNRALDNIVDRVIQSGRVPIQKISREGSRSSIQESLRPLSHRGQKFSSIAEYKQFFNNKSVWFVTTSSMHGSSIPAQFDVVIVDESSQCLEPSCLQVISRASKFILIGDSKQLQAVVKSPKARELGMGTSLFETLIANNSLLTKYLTIQYRMCQQIMNLANQLVYQGKLQIQDPRIEKRFLKFREGWRTEIPSCFIDIIDPEKPLVFINIDSIMNLWKVNESENEDHSNLQNSQNKRQLSKHEQEMKQIQNIIEIELTCFVYRMVVSLKQGAIPQNKSNVSVICAFNSSVASVLENLSRDNFVEDNEGIVLTIDKSQGIQKEAIILLLQNASSELTDNQKRLNVAMTRARSKLIIISSQQSLRQMKVHKGALPQKLKPYQQNLKPMHIQAILEINRQQ